MRWRQFSFKTKLWTTLLLFSYSSIVLAVILFHFTYREVYVRNVETSLIQMGQRIAFHYEGGEIDERLERYVDWYNGISDANIFLVHNPRELSACLPFEIDHEALIGEEERRELLNGEPLVKIGYEERFARNILAVVVPLLEQSRLSGIIYIYVPLSSLLEVFEPATPYLIGLGLLLLTLLFFAGNKIVRQLTAPLKEMEVVTNTMTTGDYSQRVHLQTNDEIGQLAKAFNRMAEAIEKEDKQKQEFLANVSHELRTPLSYIKGYSEAILQHVVTDEETKSKYMQLIYNESGRMEKLVKDLLDLARLQGESYPLTKQPIVLAQLIFDVIDNFEVILENKKITLTKKLDEEIIVEGDPDRLTEVIYNLLENAIRYSHEETTITMTLSETNHQCKLEIQDEGTGIEKDDLKRLGERFFRTDKARTRSSGGTGLGLAITKQILLLHGGRIDFESEKGKGTLVTVTLPMMEL